MNSREKIRRLFLAFVALVASGLTLACGKDQLNMKHARGEENRQNGPGSMKSPVIANTSTSSARNQVSTSGATAAGKTHTGRLIKNKEAVELADSVIVGRIVDLGERDLGAMGQTYYGQVKVEVAQTIKGATAKTVTLSLTVQKVPVEIFEETPKTGNTYILFLKKVDPKTTKGIKLIEATEENLSTISTLIRATGAEN